MTTEPMTIEIAEATRIVPASAEDIFELLASPSQHALIDGSGTVKGAQRGTPERLSPGARNGWYLGLESQRLLDFIAMNTMELKSPLELIEQLASQAQHLI